MNTGAIRKETLGCGDKIYLNSAACSLPPAVVMEKMMDWYRAEEQEGGYAVENMRRQDIQELYTELAKLLHAQPRNIAYAYSASHAYARALSSIPFREGDCILTTDDDYISNHIAFISLQKREGVQIVRARNLPNGDLDLDDFEKQIKKHKPRLVALTHVPTNSGLVQKAEEVGKLCNQYDILYLLDACQSVGQMEVDVTKLNCDFLNATGRKFLRGARASGFLYVSDKVLQMGLEPLFIDRRGADWVEEGKYKPKDNAQRFEEMEISAALIGLKEAVRYANQTGIQEIEQYNRQLVARLRKNLQQVDHLRLLDKGSTLCNIVSLHSTRAGLSAMEEKLKAARVVFSTHIKQFALIDFEKKGVDWSIRFSPHYFNTAEEMDEVADVLASV